MEKREEIKEGVKERLIEFMAEQITKEESFLELKSELVKELFEKKEIKTQVISTTGDSLLDRIAIKQGQLQQSRFEKLENFAKRVNDVRTGHEKIKLKDFIQNVGNNSSNYKDILELLEKKPEPYKAENFTDPKLHYTLSNINREIFRTTSLETIQKNIDNPLVETDLYKFEIKSFINGDNYYKTYTLMNKLEKFNFECSFVYNKQKEEKFIDKLSVDSAGFLVTNEDLGIPFALSAIEIMEKEDARRQELIALAFKKESDKVEFKNSTEEQPSSI